MGAGAKRALPGWLATIRQVPVERSVTLVAAPMVHTFFVLDANRTASLELDEANGASWKGAVPRGREDSALKLMYCAQRVSGSAARASIRPEPTASAPKAPTLRPEAACAARTSAGVVQGRYSSCRAAIAAACGADAEVP